MDRQIDQMIPPDVELMNVVIGGEGQHPQRACGEKTNPVMDGRRTFGNTAV